VGLAVEERKCASLGREGVEKKNFHFTRGKKRRPSGKGGLKEKHIVEGTHNTVLVTLSYMRSAFRKGAGGRK